MEVNTSKYYEGPPSRFLLIVLTSLSVVNTLWCIMMSPYLLGKTFNGEVRRDGHHGEADCVDWESTDVNKDDNKTVHIDEIDYEGDDIAKVNNFNLIAVFPA